MATRTISGRGNSDGAQRISNGPAGRDGLPGCLTQT